MIETVKFTAITALKHKANSVVLLDLRELSAFTDFFVICSGNSERHVESTAQKIREKLQEEFNLRPWHSEAERNSDWILLDYVDFVVHIFTQEKREFYNLEQMWSQATSIELPEIEPSTESDQFVEETSHDEFSDYDLDLQELDFYVR